MLQVQMTNEQWIDGVANRLFNRDYPTQDVERFARIRDEIQSFRAENAELRAVVESLFIACCDSTTLLEGSSIHERMMIAIQNAQPFFDAIIAARTAEQEGGG